MIAVDTNIVVTYLARPEDPGFPAVDALFASEFVFLSATVLLEAEWVLRASYKWSKRDIVGGLNKLLALPNVEVEPYTRQVLDWSLAGLAFADAMHLAAAGEVQSFVTFDRDLVRKARALDGAPLVRAPHATDV